MFDHAQVQQALLKVSWPEGLSYEDEWEAHEELFHGPRVRVGIATGLVHQGENVKDSAVYKRAHGKLRMTN